jgi:hypothetical protein
VEDGLALAESAQAEGRGEGVKRALVGVAEQPAAAESLARHGPAEHG